jgi:hypothetical protein
MNAPRLFLLLAGLLLAPAAARAGLYYSGETYASLPSQWRGFLLDHRALRNIANAQTPSVLRMRYLAEAARLEAEAGKRQLSADERADLGALYVRLGDVPRAIDVLRKAQRAHPNHFAVAANLGTAYQLDGDLPQAALALAQAVRLAPGKHLQAEEYHLKLVRDRLKRGPRSGELDDLFGVRYAGEPSKLAEAERAKLPAKAVAVVQQLALWLPADGRLLWQLGELASAHGDVRTAAAIFDGCVTQFGMTSDTLRAHRRAARAAAGDTPTAAADHKQHAGTIGFRSRRPLVGQLDLSALPPITATGVNHLPWEVFGETTVARSFRPIFPKYLQELQGKQVSLTGFLMPLRDEPEAGAFMFIENPVGCWYCEMPETTGIVYVELPAGTTTTLRRGLLRVTGRLTLNTDDPEDFLYALRDARVGPVD